MNIRFVLSALCILLALPSSIAQSVQPSADFSVETVLAYPGLQSFTWDEHGDLWLLTGAGHRLTISSSSRSNPAQITPLRTVQRLGHSQAGILVNANSIFLADGPVIRTLSILSNQNSDQSHVPPATLFPAHLEITSLHWAPLGFIYFLYHSPISGDSGIGRVIPQGTRWDVVARGRFNSLSFDSDALLIASEPSAGLFRIAPGLNYDGGLETHSKSGLALKTDRSNLKPALAVSYLTSPWTTWFVFDDSTSSIEQFREENNQVKHGRTAATLAPGSKLRSFQIGPDGQLWLLVASADDKPGSILRLRAHDQPATPPSLVDFTQLPTEKLVSELGHPNAWQRDTALRILAARPELRNARGLHPRTPLHDAFREEDTSPTAKLYVLLALHRLGLLDETFLDNVTDHESQLLRTWSALLYGERNYPTGSALQMLIKLARDTNAVTRSAAAVAARQFVSGSLAIDTPPPIMPLREVFTGGILSTLWFSTKKGSSAEFDLLFWNAVRPITEYDPVHSIGFFNGDEEVKLELAYWTIGLVTRQIAETDDPAKQEEAMIMLSELRADTPRMIIAGLRGLKNGSPNRRVIPTTKSLEILDTFGMSTNPEISSLAREIHQLWQQPFK